MLDVFFKKNFNFELESTYVQSTLRTKVNSKSVISTWNEYEESDFEDKNLNAVDNLDSYKQSMMYSRNLEAGYSHNIPISRNSLKNVSEEKNSKPFKSLRRRTSIFRKQGIKDLEI